MPGCMHYHTTIIGDISVCGGRYKLPGEDHVTAGGADTHATDRVVQPNLERLVECVFLELLLRRRRGRRRHNRRSLHVSRPPPEHVA